MYIYVVTTIHGCTLITSCAPFKLLPCIPTHQLTYAIHTCKTYSACNKYAS